MIDKTFSDNTQKAIMPHLKITEQLVSSALEKETGKECNVEITAMPDLGLANNSLRMRGGFFTGMFIEWNADVSFVPVDATVNSCGVSIFSLRKPLSFQEFKSRINNTKSFIREIGYNWNFEHGNHFVSICRNDLNQYFIVMHASADEYKKSIQEQSLYPLSNVWYYDDIKVIYTKNRDRYLRYLVGNAAKKFADIAIGLERINQERMNTVAMSIAGDLINEEVCYIPHYGMPSESSIAIGCSWKKDKSVLLSIPGRDIFIIKNIDNASKRWLTPHGFGAEIIGPSIIYKNGEFLINGVHIMQDKDIAQLNGKALRYITSEPRQIEDFINKILLKTNAKIISRLHPVVMINKDGYAVYVEK